MTDLFQREQHIYEQAVAYVDIRRSDSGCDISMLETLTDEYGIILKQLKKIVSISDKATKALFVDKKIGMDKVKELESELLNSQISIMLSQIGPHFLFNTLVAIQELCLIDPKTASEAIGEFSKYLRCNIDSLSVTAIVPFERELRHVEAYLSLEKKRFGDKLNIAYAIGTSDFSLPVLSLQPLVENAVRHGVTKREQGGTVTIITEETADNMVIRVIDDGVGFDLDANEGKSERIKVGLNNVKMRLVAMCNGTLELESSPDAGTTVTVLIPRVTM